ncbi:hypothetical protein BC943DRAFT_142924 [Umbelopsis sp. AD052]|nr:hypothetical protein BC943DRAFT_142924 [Umbelopsis sp. AD052]
MKDLIAVDLIIPPSVQFFGPKPNSSHSTHPRRQKIRGKLRLVCSKPIRLRQIEIKFKGEARLNWRDPQKGPHSLTAEKLDAVKLLRKTRQSLLEDATLPAGVTELGFEIPISGWLCQTFKSNFLTISFLVMAKLTPTGKLAYPIRSEKELVIHKTLIPKDVACGHVPGFIVPRTQMKGERPDVLKWKFQVPKWAYLDNEIQFEGTFSQGLGGQCTINKIEVDVVQEEVYRSDTKCCPEQWQVDNSDFWVNDVTSWFFPNHALPKRHLVSSYTSPSVYLHPPMETSIPFAFPLTSRASDNASASLPLLPTSSMPRLRRVQSAPMKTLAMTTTSHPSTKTLNHVNDTISSIGFSRIQTLCSKGVFHETMDSPFLRVRQYIRVVVHVTYLGNSYPICIGLPFAVTRAIQAQPDESAEGLPTYQSLARDAERLPDYTTNTAVPDYEEDPSDGEQQQRSSRRRRRRHGPDIDDLAREIGDLAVGRVRTKSKSNPAMAAERRMDDFLVMI